MFEFSTLCDRLKKSNDDLEAMNADGRLKAVEMREYKALDLADIHTLAYTHQDFIWIDTHTHAHIRAHREREREIDTLMCAHTHTQMRNTLVHRKRC